MRIFAIAFILLFVSCGPTHQLEVFISVDSTLQAQYDSGKRYAFIIFDSAGNELYSQFFDKSGEQKFKTSDLPTQWGLFPEIQVFSCEAATADCKIMEGSLSAVDPLSRYSQTDNSFGIFDGEVVSITISMKPATTS